MVGSDSATAGPLRPDRVAVDDLTLDALKQKLRMLEQRLGAVQNELALKTQLLNQHETDLQACRAENATEIELVPPRSDQTNEQNRCIEPKLNWTDV